MLKRLGLVLIAVFLFFAMTNCVFAIENEFKGVRIKVDIPEGSQVQEINQVVITGPGGVGSVVVQRMPLNGVNLKIMADVQMSVFKGSGLISTPEGSYKFSGTINGLVADVVLYPDENNKNSCLLIMILGDAKSLNDIASSVRPTK